MSQIYFIRHGQTDWNKDDKLRGWADIPLNSEGKKESKDAAEQLKRKHITSILAADLPRVRQTAQILSTTLGAPVTLSKSLRDWDYGKWTGVPVKEILPRMLHIMRVEKGRPPDGEDYAHMLERVEDSFKRVLNHAQRVPGNYAIVSSNRIARILLSYMDDNPKWILQKQDPLENGGIINIYRHKDQWDWRILSHQGRSLGFAEE